MFAQFNENGRTILVNPERVCSISVANGKTNMWFDDEAYVTVSMPPDKVKQALESAIRDRYFSLADALSNVRFMTAPQ